jgi:PhnB protein
MIMLADENPQSQAKSPETVGGSTNSLHLYAENVDSVVDKAVKAGAKLLRPVADQFYGDRMGSLLDPFGQIWSVGTHVEDVSPEEMKKRMNKMASQAAG